jgi:hypothetical protein
MKIIKTKVARDSKGQIMWVRGRTDLSVLTYREWKEGEDMLSGEWKEGEDMLSGRIRKTTGLGLYEHVFIPPFTLSEEEI